MCLRFYHITILALIFVLGCEHSRGVSQDQEYTGHLKAGDAPQDDGTLVVRRFYAMLLSDKKPTRADEEAIFCESATGTYLKTIAKTGGEAPLCELFRKEFYNYYNPQTLRNSGLPAVSISNTLQWVAEPDGPRQSAQPGSGYVMAGFYAKDQQGTLRQRQVIFEISKGKIDPDGTRTGWVFNETVYSRIVPVTGK